MENTRFTLFISDLHLHPDQPQITSIFLQFLQHEAMTADSLYILGDLFEAWIGDDDLNPFTQQIIQALRQVTQSGLPVYFMRGNRDFLIGKQFARHTDVKLIPDPTVIDLYGKKTLLMHGDSLCTADVKHQLWRKISLARYNPYLALWLPLTWRRKIGRWLRGQSRQHQYTLPDHIMDVTEYEVRRMMDSYQVTQLIHGHTHRPRIHQVALNTCSGQRIVLGAWHEIGNVLRCDNQGNCVLSST